MLNFFMLNVLTLKHLFFISSSSDDLIVEVFELVFLSSDCRMKLITCRDVGVLGRLDWVETSLVCGTLSWIKLVVPDLHVATFRRQNNVSFFFGVHWLLVLLMSLNVLGSSKLLINKQVTQSSTLLWTDKVVLQKFVNEGFVNCKVDLLV